MTLFESGWIALQPNDGVPIEVRRGMTILTNEGQIAGKVAAVVMDKHGQNVTHLLLSRLRQTPEYRLVSVNLITQMKEGIVWLDLYQRAIENLPLRKTF